MKRLVFQKSESLLVYQGPGQILCADNANRERHRGHTLHVGVASHVGGKERVLIAKNLGLQDIAAVTILAEAAIVDLHVPTIRLVVECNHLTAHAPEHLEELNQSVSSRKEEKQELEKSEPEVTYLWWEVA